MSRARFDPEVNFQDRARFDPEGIFHGSGGFGETRMNRSTYEFIKDNCLWSAQGLQRYRDAMLDGIKPPIRFPVDSIEVKVAWLKFTDSQIRDGMHNRYYTAEHEAHIYGLTSFHILTKDLPKWFWATFHHREAPENQFELPDNYGPPAQVAGTVWENYVLGGTQTDFVDEIGRKIILSDYYIEHDFLRSSCISCHSQASSNVTRNERDQITLQSINGPKSDRTLIGTPKPGLYLDPDTDTMKFIPTDFVWSIPIRAHRETATPPERCIWTR